MEERLKEERKESCSSSKTERNTDNSVESHSPAVSKESKMMPTEKSAQTQDLESNNRLSDHTADASSVVDWTGPNDPENPLNWSPFRKWACVALVSAVTFVTSLASTILAPGVPLLMAGFHSNSEALASFVVSVYIIGFCVGPLAIAPLSELYGRAPVFHISNVIFLASTVACAVSVNLPMFIVFRLFMGISGCTPLTLGGGVIADLIKQEKRGMALSIWSIGPLLGPVLGPISGGYLTLKAGWRWSFWLVVIISGLLTVISLLFLSETYAPTILNRKTKRLRRESGNKQLKSKLGQQDSPRALFAKAIIRPMKLLCFSPIVLILALDLSVVYSYIYLLFTTFTFVFEDSYGFNTGEAGLAYLGLGIGFSVGVFGCGAFSDGFVKKKSAHGAMKPEYRLPPLIVGAFLVPLGLLWYGWTTEFHIHWIVPVIGTSFIGTGMMCTFMPIQVYLVDAFTTYAASATATNTVMRSLFGAVVPLAGQQMYAALGLGWGNSLLGFIALALSPVPFVLIRYGERIRLDPRFQVDL